MHHAAVFAVCQRYARDIPEAGEYTNRAFLKAFRSLEQYSGEGPLGGWLYRIAVHTCIDEIRRRKREPEVALEEASAVSVEPAALDNLQVEDLLKMVRQLPEMDQAVFNLYVIDGFSHREIGEKLSIGTSTSRWYLNRAKNQLKEILQRSAIQTTAYR